MGSGESRCPVVASRLSQIWVAWILNLGDWFLGKSRKFVNFIYSLNKSFNQKICVRISVLSLSNCLLSKVGPELNLTWGTFIKEKEQNHECEIVQISVRALEGLVHKKLKDAKVSLASLNLPLCVAICHFISLNLSYITPNIYLIMPIYPKGILWRTSKNKYMPMIHTWNLYNVI